ncbi:MAG: hypothetical protein ABIV94_02625 [Acidimicrobiales bacterium]
MTAAAITTVGIMFDLAGDFPTLDELGRTNHVNTYGMDLPDDLLAWLAVAYDPRGLSYGDEDDRAVAVTNFAVILDEAGGPDAVPRFRYDSTPDTVTEARDAGAALVDGVLIVDPARDDIVPGMIDCAGALAEYPLLDDDAYSSLEWEAWQEYAPDALRWEITGACRDGLLTDEQADELLAGADDMLPVLAGALHYYYGFSGEYGPPFLTVLAELVELAGAVPEVVR